LAPDPELPGLARILGKGYLLPAPIMPLAEWQTSVLPTPMAVCQAELPITALLYDPEGNEILRHRLGRLPRSHDTAIEIDALAGIAACAAATATSSSSTIFPAAAKPTVGFTRCSAIATGVAACR